MDRWWIGGSKLPFPDIPRKFHSHSLWFFASLPRNSKLRDVVAKWVAWLCRSWTVCWNLWFLWSVVTFEHFWTMSDSVLSLLMHDECPRSHPVGICCTTWRLPHPRFQHLSVTSQGPSVHDPIVSNLDIFWTTFFLCITRSPYTPYKGTWPHEIPWVFGWCWMKLELQGQHPLGTLSMMLGRKFGCYNSWQRFG